MANIKQPIVCKKAEIFGKVQGVWYRGSTEKMAKKLGVTGWVRNRVDGSVEALFQGDGQTVEKMISWCHDGPPSAIVERVDVTDELIDDKQYLQFEVRY
ncbi:MAG: acylphosphatase [Magnetococcales bacterium]|nr:acylphosphatase [Magnetococcales bacterium]